MNTNKIESIWKYPIKGLPGQKMGSVSLRPGAGIPGDRRFALRHAKSAFDPASPVWHRKREFAQMVHHETLAKLDTHLDPETGLLTIKVRGNTLFVGNIQNDAARRGASFVISRIAADPRGPLELVDAGAVSLTDIATPALSIINLASLREFGARVGMEIDARRFRGNVVFDSPAPWIEFGWVGREIKLGSATLKVMKTIDRCAATSINPQTAVRDLQLPNALLQIYNHLDCGIYAEVIAPGRMAPGDPVAVL